MKKRLIAVVDDELEVLETISGFFTGRNFRVKTFQQTKDFIKSLDIELPDVIILDLMFPLANGLNICKLLKSKEKTRSVPIIILSGKTDEDDKVEGLQLGADDYVIKPFSLKELHARVNVALRKQLPQKKRNEIIVNSAITIFPSRYEVIVDGEKIDLTPTEFKILECLASRKGQIFTRESILEHIWEGEKIVTTQTIDVHIEHIRKKLGKHAKIIISIRGFGYKIE